MENLEICIDGKRIGVLTEAPYPVAMEKSTFTEPTEHKEFTFEGLYVPGNADLSFQLVYTTRRKGTIYFKVVDHPALKSISTSDAETYKLFDGVKRGTIFSGKMVSE